MDNVIFTNNLGSVEFQRFMLSIGNEWLWDGRRVARKKTVSVTGWVKDVPEERIDGILSPSTTATGQLGTLTLPWTTLSNIKIQSIDYPESIWIDYTAVSAVFMDDYPDNNLYTLSWFGHELHAPRFSSSIPTRTIQDEYPHLEPGNGSFDRREPGGSVMRTRNSPGLMELNLAGTIEVDGVLSEQLLMDLVRRANVDPNRTFSDLTVPGYPEPFDMVEACPELANSIPFTRIIVAGARIAWDVENGLAQISVNMLAQPQRMV